MKNLLICVSIFLVGMTHTNAQDYPILTEFVTDQADIMTLAERTSLQEKLIAYEAKKTHQIVVLTIDNLNGDTIENYAFWVFNNNGIGQKEEDNGILVLFSKADREVRIEVGNGFEPIITDAFASRIIRNVMIPEFKGEYYFKGIDDGVNEVIKLIDDPKYRDEFAEVMEEEGQMPLWGKLLFGLFLVGFLGLFIVVGGRLFVSGYKTLIDIYKGFIIGKISVLAFPFMVLGTTLGILFSLPFILMPLLFGYFFIGQGLFGHETDLTPEDFIDAPNLVYYLVGAAVTLLIVIPLLTAFISKKPYQALKLSLIKNDKKYISKNISSSGSSWGSSSGSSSSFSSSSSSSFSGGGGSSSGGGASGSW